MSFFEWENLVLNIIRRSKFINDLFEVFSKEIVNKHLYNCERVIRGTKQSFNKTQDLTINTICRSIKMWVRSISINDLFPNTHPPFINVIIDFSSTFYRPLQCIEKYLRFLVIN